MTIDRRTFLQAAGALSVSFTVPLPLMSNAADSSAAVTLGNRLVIDASGTVQLVMGKVELGQGIGTAMAQLVAEELDGTGFIVTTSGHVATVYRLVRGAAQILLSWKDWIMGPLW